eukprot:TRINITY_DN8687_c0_g2_i15.p1 TRINITY_DN8687_c0_g2~~TRINITY_DN8687_c0_g2_i15.p1  ORF type:complete len:199 (-),score=16.95 TRINITY_DN8687_c0_g2_i15:26-622(-)
MCIRDRSQYQSQHQQQSESQLQSQQIPNKQQTPKHSFEQEEQSNIQSLQQQQSEMGKAISERSETLNIQDFKNDLKRKSLARKTTTSSISSEKEERSEIENQLLGLSGQMKNLALNFSKHLENEKYILDNVENQQDKNIGHLRKSHKSLVQASKDYSISIWRLLMMSAIAIGLFIITCLLYTSPSPRDRQKSRMPSSA